MEQLTKKLNYARRTTLYAIYATCVLGVKRICSTTLASKGTTTAAEMLYSVNYP